MFRYLSEVNTATKIGMTKKKVVTFQRGRMIWDGWGTLLVRVVI